MRIKPPSRQRTFHFCLSLPCFALLLTGCNLPGRSVDAPPVDQVSASAMSIDEALAIEPEDRRPTVLEEMGAPDVFQIHFQELEGQTVRWESWSYFEFNSAFEFIDGELLWTIDLEPVEDGSFYAHFYDPRDFTAFMSEAEVRILLEGQDLEAVDLSEGDIPAGMVLAGDQILLGFDQNRLVYVETFMLSPAVEGELAGYLPTAEPAPLPATPEPATPTVQPTLAPTPVLAPSGSPTNTTVPGQSAPRAAGSLVFKDDFEGPASQASALFGSEYMSFDLADGGGRLGSAFPQGVVVATYGETKMKDFIAEFDLFVDNPKPGLKAGLIFRSEDAAGGLDYYYNLFLLPFERRIGLNLWKDGAWKLDQTYPIPGVLIPDDGAYRVRIEAEGQQFRVFLNGTFIHELTDSQLAGEGIFGLSLVSAQPPESVLFDNLRIFELK